MSINHLIWQSLKKNIRNYYLYIFALVFSAAIYFAFVTLQFDPALNDKTDSMKWAAGIKAGSILLIVIVSVFLLYANNLFIKRRSSEIGLYQLVGMSKAKIFRILSIENFALYAGSLIIGIFIGFAVSKLMKLIFFQLTGIDQAAELSFSLAAMLQTILVFLGIYLLIMIMNFIFIKGQSVLSLFQARSTTENPGKKLSVAQILIGILGIGLIGLGYFWSTKLFSGNTDESLIFGMLGTLGSVIIGTYLFFKGSVSFILQLIRKSKDGYLSINNVLSLSSIMFRMKSNAVLLTVITTVSALAIGLLSLTYISYYSAEETAKDVAPDDFAIGNTDGAEDFMEKLDEHKIDYRENKIDFSTVHADLTHELKSDAFGGGTSNMSVVVISDESTDDINLGADEAVLTGITGADEELLSYREKGKIILSSKTETIDVENTDLLSRSILPSFLTPGSPAIVVNDKTYNQLAKDPYPDIRKGSESAYVGINIPDEEQLHQANDIFTDWYDLNEMDYAADSYLESVNMQKRSNGLVMFIVGFTGLAFLITSGCILYFKQMDESEEEKPTYTVLRKLGFTQGDLAKGIWYKQLFNFGIPLLLGLLHSYFAVKAGWIMFGAEMVTPTIIVMVIYTALYSIFGVLSVFYYKRIIRESL